MLESKMRPWAFTVRLCTAWFLLLLDLTESNTYASVRCDGLLDGAVWWGGGSVVKSCYCFPLLSTFDLDFAKKKNKKTWIGWSNDEWCLVAVVKKRHLYATGFILLSRMKLAIHIQTLKHDHATTNKRFCVTPCCLNRTMINTANWAAALFDGAR